MIAPGALVGEMSFVDGAVHTVGLRALCDCRVLSLRRKDFENMHWKLTPFASRKGTVDTESFKQLERLRELNRVLKVHVVVSGTVDEQ